MHERTTIARWGTSGGLLDFWAPPRGPCSALNLPVFHIIETMRRGRAQTQQPA